MKLIKIYNNQEYLKQIADWRNAEKVNLRSCFDTGYDGQGKWAESIGKSNDQYYFITQNDELVGYCGLDKIHVANRTAEISLLIGSQYQKTGYGSVIVAELLGKAFNCLNLNLVYAETYFNKEFWIKCRFKEEVVLRDRKYWEGGYYNSTILSITKDEYYDNSRS